MDKQSNVTILLMDSEQEQFRQMLTFLLAQSKREHRFSFLLCNNDVSGDLMYDAGRAMGITHILKTEQLDTLGLTDARHLTIMIDHMEGITDWRSTMLTIEQRLPTTPVFVLSSMPHADKSSPIFGEYLARSLGRAFDDARNVLYVSRGDTPDEPTLCLKEDGVSRVRIRRSISMKQLSLAMNASCLAHYRETNAALLRQWQTLAEAHGCMQQVVQDGILDPEAWFSATHQAPSVLVVLGKWEDGDITEDGSIGRAPVVRAAEMVYRALHPTEDATWLGCKTAASHLRACSKLCQNLAIIAKNKLSIGITIEQDTDGRFGSCEGFQPIREAQITLINADVILYEHADVAQE